VYLVDANIFLEGLLKQEKSDLVSSFFQNTDLSKIFISDFALFSIGIIMVKLIDYDSFIYFLDDMFLDRSRILSVDKTKLDFVIKNSKDLNLDFDDAYQYSVAKLYDLELVTFDKDFNKTDVKKHLLK